MHRNHNAFIVSYNILKNSNVTSLEIFISVMKHNEQSYVENMFVSPDNDFVYEYIPKIKHVDFKSFLNKAIGRVICYDCRSCNVWHHIVPLQIKEMKKYKRSNIAVLEMFSFRTCFECNS